jgi:hypothetical protein
MASESGLPLLNSKMNAENRKSHSAKPLLWIQPRWSTPMVHWSLLHITELLTNTFTRSIQGHQWQLMVDRRVCAGRQSHSTESWKRTVVRLVTSQISWHHTFMTGQILIQVEYFRCPQKTYPHDEPRQWQTSCTALLGFIFLQRSAMWEAWTISHEKEECQALVLHAPKSTSETAVSDVTIDWSDIDQYPSELPYMDAGCTSSYMINDQILKNHK